MPPLKTLLSRYDRSPELRQRISRSTLAGLLRALFKAQQKKD